MNVQEKLKMPMESESKLITKGTIVNMIKERRNVKGKNKRKKKGKNK